MEAAKLLGPPGMMLWSRSLSLSSVVAAVWIFRMFQVPQRPTACNRGNRGKVVGWWRRTCRPLKRPRVPGIVARLLAFPVRNDEVQNKDQYCNRLYKRANRDDEVHRDPTTSGLVGVNPAWHAKQTGKVHDI